MIRIAIADDNALIAKNLIESVDESSELKLKHYSKNGEELIEQLKQDHMLDVILMDIEMPRMNGIEATRIIKSQWPQIKIVMFTVFDDDQNLFESIKAGASGYLLKDEPFETIEQGLIDALDGQAPMTGSMALKTLKLLQSVEIGISEPKDYHLSKRETQVLEQLCSGLTYTEISENLIISPSTVRKHIENVYTKLHVHSKLEAVELAKKHRLF